MMQSLISHNIWLKMLIYCTEAAGVETPARSASVAGTDIEYALIVQDFSDLGQSSRMQTEECRS
jgi:hypothetical protein